MRQLFVGFLFLVVASVVRAGLGESAEQLEDSYGGLVSRHLRDDGALAVVYQKDRYLINVIFERGVSVAEEYSRADQADLTEKEIARFLKANAGRKMTWSRSNVTGPEQARKFERSDGRAEATATRGSLKVKARTQ